MAITSIFHYLKIVYGNERFEDKGITFYLENHFFSFIFILLQNKSTNNLTMKNKAFIGAIAASLVPGQAAMAQNKV